MSSFRPTPNCQMACFISNEPGMMASHLLWGVKNLFFLFRFPWLSVTKRKEEKVFENVQQKKEAFHHSHSRFWRFTEHLANVKQRQFQHHHKFPLEIALKGLRLNTVLRIGKTEAIWVKGCSCMKREFQVKKVKRWYSECWQMPHLMHWTCWKKCSSKITVSIEVQTTVKLQQFFLSFTHIRLSIKWGKWELFQWKFIYENRTAVREFSHFLSFSLISCKRIGKFSFVCDEDSSLSLDAR